MSRGERAIDPLPVNTRTTVPVDDVASDESAADPEPVKISSPGGRRGKGLERRRTGPRERLEPVRTRGQRESAALPSR